MEGRADRSAGVHGVLFDLLMAVMNSLDVWSAAAGDGEQGLAWRDAVTARMLASNSYIPYRTLVSEEAAAIGLPSASSSRLFDRWTAMQPWPDATAVRRLDLPYAFVTNCSAALARVAARASGLTPRFVLSAQEAGWYKPEPRVYLEACRRLELPPARTLFVAGAVYDAEGAHRAGLHATLVVRRSGQRLPGRPVRVVSSLDEALAGMVTTGGEW
jgi:2-haloacid dehalogenase